MVVVCALGTFSVHARLVETYLMVAAGIGSSCGRKADVGHRPVGIALPASDGAHVILDLALPVAARSKIRRAAERDEPIPARWATDAQGTSPTDAAMLSEIPNANLVPQAKANVGHRFIVIDVAGLMPTKTLSSRQEDAQRILNDGEAPDRKPPPRLPGAGALSALQSARRQ